jgi:hypothetical protein
VGLPYWFETDNEIIDMAPDRAQILQITSPCDSIVVLRADEVNPNPVIRCTLRGINGRHIICHPIETHGLVFLEDPKFLIYKDHHPVSEGGDFLLRIHGGSKNFRPFPHLESEGMCATLSLGNASRAVTTDSPPADFVANVCAARRVHLALGCVDQARIPTISISDILLAGGVEGLSSRAQVIGFITGILKNKYFKEDLEEPEKGTDLARIRQRANKIIQDHCIDRNHTTLVWAREGEGLSSRMARQVCRLLQGEDFSPQLITSLNGISTLASDEDFFDVNPALFPSHEFVQVDLINGCVNVSNFTPGGRVSCIGSANVVR